MQEQQTIYGTVTQIVFQNTENGYVVLRLLARDGEEMCIRDRSSVTEHTARREE